MSPPFPPVEGRFKHPIGPAVHAILKHEWDPIASLTPDDEYDEFVWPLIDKVVQGEGAEQIADYLDWASNEYICCPLPRETKLAIAQKLVALKPAKA
jgi:hypothetical protein